LYGHWHPFTMMMILAALLWFATSFAPACTSKQDASQKESGASADFKLQPLKRLGNIWTTHIGSKGRSGNWQPCKDKKKKRSYRACKLQRQRGPVASHVYVRTTRRRKLQQRICPGPGENRTNTVVERKMKRMDGGTDSRFKTWLK
jgi:hypothetical protein